MEPGKSDLIYEKMNLAEAQLHALEKNVSDMKTPELINVPDVKLNCFSILSELAMVSNDLRPLCDANFDLEADTRKEFKTKIEDFHYLASELATEIMSLWPPLVQRWLWKIDRVREIFSKLREIAAIFGGPPADSNNPVDTVQTAEDKTTNGGADAGRDQEMPVGTEKPVTPETEVAKTEDVKKPDLTPPIEELVKPVPVPEPEPVNLSQEPESPAPEKTEEPKVPEAEVAKAEDVKKPDLTPQIEEPMKPVPVPESEPVNLSQEPESPAPPEKAEEPKVPEAEVAKAEDVKKADLVSEGKEDPPKAIEPSAIKKKPKSKEPDLPQKPAKTAKPGESPLSIIYLAAEKRAVAGQDLPPAKEAVSSDPLLGTILTLRSNIANKITRLEKQIGELTEQEHQDVLSEMADLEQQVGELTARERDASKILKDQFRPQSGLFYDALKRLKDGLRLATERVTAPYAKEKPDLVTSRKDRAPVEPQVPDEPKVPVEVLDKKDPEKPKGEKPIVPPEKERTPVRDPRQPSLLAQLLSAFRFYFVFVLVAFGLVWGGWFLFSQLRSASQPERSSPAAAPEAKQKKLSPAFEPFFTGNPKSLEKRALNLMVIYLKENPEPGGREKTASMLSTWRWKGVPDVLLETAANDPEERVSKEAFASFKAITGYPGLGGPRLEEVKNWWKEHKSEIDPQLEDAD